MQETLETYSATHREAPWSPAAHFARIASGLALVCAAALKLVFPLKPLWIVAMGAKGDAVSSAQIAGEAALGAALLLNLVPPMGVFLASLLFAAFSAYSVYLWERSAQSCGCFGNVHVPPLITASFDAFAAVSLAAAAKYRPCTFPPELQQRRAAATAALGLLLAGSLFWQGRRAAASEEEALSVDTQMLDLGTLNEREADAIDHEFVLTNRTPHPITIDRVSHSCACTSVEPAAISIPPNGRAKLKVHLNWSGRRGMQLAAVFVHTLNPDGMVELTISGLVNPGIGVVPPIVDFGTVEPDSALERFVMVARTDEPADATPQLAGLQPLISKEDEGRLVAEPVKMRGQDDGARWYRIRIASERLAPGLNESHITFTLDGSGLKPARLVVRATLPPNVAATACLRFRLDETGTEAASFHARPGLGPLTFRIVQKAELRSPFEIFATRSERSPAGTDYQVEIRATGVNPVLGDAFVIGSVAGRDVASVALLRF